jgi:hypothetical protein
MGSQVLRLPRVMALVGAVCGVLFLSQSSAAVAQSPAQVYPQATSQANGGVSVDVRADNVHNLGAFQMVLSWDPGVVSLQKIDDGAFLAQSGRKPLCPAPVTDQSAVRFTCVTTAPLAQISQGAVATPTTVPGVNGNGTLARAQFTVLRKGDPKFHLSHVKLVDPVGVEVASTTSDSGGDVHLAAASSSSSPDWLVIGGGIGGAVVLLLVLGGVGLVVARRRARTRDGQRVG